MKGFLAVVGSLIAVSAVVVVLAGASSPRVPKGVAVIDIRARRGFSRRISDPAEVKRIVGWVNSLQHARDAFACGGGGGGDVTLTFRSAGGSTLATADAPAAKADSCSPVNLTVNLTIGTQSWPRVDRAKGMPLIDHLEHLLGPRFQPVRVIAG